MISWIQNFIQKNGRIVFGLLIVITILAFVVMFTPAGTSAFDTGPRTKEANVWGYTVTNDRVQREISQNGQISYMLQSPYFFGYQPSYAFIRLAALDLADELGVPGPNASQFRDFVRSLGRFQGRDGDFDSDAYTTFVDDIRSQDARITEQDLMRIIEEDFRIEQVRNRLGGAGATLPFEVRKAVERENTSFDVAVATFNFAAFDPGITPTEDDLRAYFANNRRTFEVPEKMKLDILEISWTDLVDQVDTTAFSEDELREHYRANKARFDRMAPDNQFDLPDTIAAPDAPKEDYEPTFEDVRTFVVEDYAKGRAERLALEKADALSQALYEKTVARDSDAYKALLEEYGVNVTTPPPFSRDEPPRFTSLNAERFDNAWLLGDEAGAYYYSDAIPSRTGAAVLIYRGTEEAYIPKFETVKDDVETAYLADEKTKAYNERGRALYAELSEAADSEEAFVAEAEKAGLTVKTYDGVRQQSPPQGFNRQLTQYLFQTMPKSVSPMRRPGQDGVFLYIAAATVDLPEDIDAAIADRLQNQRDRYASSAQISMISEKMIRDMEEAGLTDMFSSR